MYWLNVVEDVGMRLFSEGFVWIKRNELMGKEGRKVVGFACFRLKFLILVLVVGMGWVGGGSCYQ